jgi:periplasmic protein TonB
MSVSALDPHLFSPPLAARRCGRCVSSQQSPPLLLSWVLAVAVSSLAVGLVGLGTPIAHPIHLLSFVPPPEGDEAAEVTLFEMAAPMGFEELAEEDTVALTPPEALLEQAQVLPETVLQTLDTPEVVEVLTAEAVFEVPAAQPVEAALEPNEPTPPKPEPRPTPTPRRSSSTADSNSPPRSSSSSSSQVGPSGGGGGTGGTGSSRRGSSKGYFPAPPYPSAARSRGMQGTVYLSITFGADGRATAVAVARSSGYSELDRAASDWVRRKWRAPAGQVGTFRQPVEYQLR